MRRQRLSAREIQVVSSAGAASLVLMLVVWLVLPRLDALVFSADAPVPVAIQWFRQLYWLWPFILIGAATAAVLLGQLPAGSVWRRGLVVLDVALAGLAITLVLLGVFAVYLAILMLPATI